MYAWLIAAALGAPLDLNTATADQLSRLPGLGPSKSAAIIEWREDNGPFFDLDELLLVPHIGPGTLENLRTKLKTTRDEATQRPRHSGQVNINTADELALCTLPGIGPAEAAKIAAGRPFTSCTGLAELQGFGPATVANLSGRCRTSD
jgi:competence ComEA-like helix-hairpin-helix protein